MTVPQTDLAPGPLLEHDVTVQASMMVAHSLSGDVFGPAQALHGATYVVSATFSHDRLDQDGVVVDIGAAGDGLVAALADLTYSNLDEHPELAGHNTTTEVLAVFLAHRLLAAARAGDLGPGARDLTSLRVLLGENPAASAGCTLRLRAARPVTDGTWPWS